MQLGSKYLAVAAVVAAHKETTATATTTATHINSKMSTMFIFTKFTAWSSHHIINIVIIIIVILIFILNNPAQQSKAKK